VTDKPSGKDGRIHAVTEITNQRGLHARASAKFVETVARYTCEVTVTKDGTSVSGRSIMGLMMLGAGKGSVIELSIEGSESKAAMHELLLLIRSKFHEDQ
jgi:phosphocarrier protein HPr